MTNHTRSRAFVAMFIAAVAVPLAPGFVASAHELRDSVIPRDLTSMPGVGAQQISADPLATVHNQAAVGLARSLLALSGAEKSSSTARGFAAAHLALDSNVATHGADLPALGRETTALAGAERVVRVLNEASQPDLKRAVGIALLTSQSQGADERILAAAPRTRPDSLMPILDQIVHANGVALSQSDATHLRALPRETQGALASFLDSYLVLDSSSSALFHDWRASGETTTPEMFGSLLSAPGSIPEPRATGTIARPAPITRAAADHPELDAAKLSAFLSARSEVLRQTVNLQDVLTRNAAPDAELSLLVPPAIAIDLTGHDNVYEDDFAVIIDAGGNDKYLNNAGGNGAGSSDPTTTKGTAVLLDLGGNDAYGNASNPRSYGVNGGGWLGSGLLIDDSGDDRYIAGGIGINGGGMQGAGMIIDGAGNDSYVSAENGNFYTGNGANGGVFVGLGALIDGAGRDTYDAPFFGSNGGGFFAGEGALIDAGDTADNFISCAGGVNGGGQGVGPSGFLLDAGGDDAYDTHSCRGYGNAAAGNGAGENNGAGLLADLGGDDVYNGSVDSNGAGAYSGVGLLIDASGNDSYTGGLRVNGGGFVGGVGMLVDVSGNDAYAPNILLNDYYGTGNGGGGYGGFGDLIDLSGDDRYIGGDAAVNGGVVDSDNGLVGWPVGLRAPSPATGFLLDAAGNDIYVAGSRGTNGGAANGGNGFLYDAAGDDQYRGGDSATNGGGLLGGEGTLIDMKGTDSYVVTGDAGTNGGSAGYSQGPCTRPTGCVLADVVHAAGLLLDAEGNDQYVDGASTRIDASVLPKGLNGQQLDLPVDPAVLHFPPTVPGAPEQVGGTSRADPRNGADVDLKWHAPSDSGGLGVTHFLVYRGPSPDALDLIGTVGDDARTFVDVGATPDTTVYYGVQAQNHLGNGPVTLVAVDVHFCTTPRDAAGHTCKNVPYAWQDTAAGTLLDISYPTASSAITLPFSFSWYGATNDQVFIGSQGLVCFSAVGCSADRPDTFPSPGQPGGVVACYWMPLFPGVAGGTVTYATSGVAPNRVFAVSYDHVPYSNSFTDETQTFQIQLHESGEADCMLADVVESNYVTIGTEGPNGTAGLLYAAGLLGAHQLGIGFVPPV